MPEDEVPAREVEGPEVRRVVSSSETSAGAVFGRIKRLFRNRDSLCGLVEPEKYEGSATSDIGIFFSKSTTETECPLVRGY